MNALQAAELIAPFVEKDVNRDRQDIYRIIKLACNKAHQTGNWFGYAAEFFVKTFRDSSGRHHVITPKSHNILLAATISSDRPILRDKQYMFHRNNYGDAHMKKAGGWQTDIIDLGHRPTLNGYDFPSCEPFLVGARALGAIDSGKSVYIEGLFEDSSQVYTYESFKKKVDACCNGCSSISEEEHIKTVSGIRIPLSDKFVYIDNVAISQIRSIRKDHTPVPVEVCAIHPDGEVVQIAVLEPYEKQSKYRDYLVPDSCCIGEVAHLLCKISEQEDLISDTQSVIIQSEEALIALSQGIHNLYWKKDVDMGIAFINQGVQILEGQKRQQEPNSNFPIQVEFLGGHNDVPKVIQHFS